VVKREPQLNTTCRGLWAGRLDREETLKKALLPATRSSLSATRFTASGQVAVISREGNCARGFPSRCLEAPQLSVRSGAAHGALRQAGSAQQRFLQLSQSFNETCPAAINWPADRPGR